MYEDNIGPRAPAAGGHGRCFPLVSRTMRAADRTSVLAADLAEVLALDAERLARRWAAASRAETSERPSAELTGKAVRDPLLVLIAEASRLLISHGADAPRIFGEVARDHGKLRFEQRFSAGDLVREFHALGGLILSEWRRRGHAVEPALVAMVYDLSGSG